MPVRFANATPPPPPRKNKRKPPRKPARKQPQNIIAESTREILIGRLESATAGWSSNIASMPLFTWLMATLFPEDFAGRQTPRTAAMSPPGTPDRVADYTERASREESLWHPGDAGAEAAAQAIEDRMELIAVAFVETRDEDESTAD